MTLNKQMHTKISLSPCAHSRKRVGMTFFCLVTLNPVLAAREPLDPAIVASRLQQMRDQEALP